MTNRTSSLDKLIYKDIRDMEIGDNLELTYAKEGFTDIELEKRLKQLSDKGFINIIESIGQTTVCGISKAGHNYFQSVI